MSTITRTELHQMIDTLPESLLTEVAYFLEFIFFKVQNQWFSKKRIEPLQLEIQAFEQLHPMLKQQYQGQFVAIHEGAVIDTAPSFEPLFLRLQNRLQSQQILIRQVTDSPEESYYLRSPRVEVL
jgi:hypothetical protein